MSDEPLVLEIGTEVSAKYKGAFCEAKIKKVNRNVKCKVTLKTSSSVINIIENDIETGIIKMGHVVLIRYLHNNVQQIVEALVNKVFDQSLYTVVFDDGDEATLKRTSLCLKSGKHYSESETLDQLPLTHPEHFSIPVNLGRRSRRKPNALSSPMQLSRKKIPKNKPPSVIQSDSNDSDEEKEIKPTTMRRNPKQIQIPRNPDCGKVVCVDYGDKRGSKSKDVWFPALIVSVSDSDPKEEGKEYTVRSFRDERYYKVNKKDARDFNKLHNKVYSSTSDCSSELRLAINKAIGYLEQSALPDHWGTVKKSNTQPQPQPRSTEDTEDSAETNEDESSNSNLPSKSSVRKNLIKKFDDDYEEDEDEDDVSDSDIEIGVDDDEDEAQEKHRRQQEQLVERDVFVAQLFKFMDERGTPINTSPSVNGVELNLYKLHRIVTKMGGPTRVNNQNQWRRVFNKLGLANADGPGGSFSLLNDSYSGDRYSEDESEDGASSTNSPVSQLKDVYKEYLHPFYDLNRKLGSTACLNDFRRNISRPSRGERKREEERSRVNSTSSVSSIISTPTSSNVRKSGMKFVKAASKTYTESQLGSSDNSPLNSCAPSADPGEGTSSTSYKDNNKTPKAKPDEKKRKSKKDFDSDSNETISKQSTIKKEDTENEDSQMTGPSSINDGDSDDESGNRSSNISNKVDESEISIGDGLKVKYGKGKQLKVYEAKVIKNEYDHNHNRYKYLVHYYGWSSRYDEWIYRNRIVQVVRDQSPRRRTGKVKNKGEPLPADASVSIDDEDEQDNKIEVVVRSHIKSEPTSSKSPKVFTPSDGEKRNRIKDEPVKERSASLSKVKSSDDLTRSRARTASFSQKESTFSARKEKTAKLDESGKSSVSTPSSSNNKRTKSQQTPSSNVKEGKTSSKIQIKKSDSDDEITKGSSKKEKKKSSDKRKEKRISKENTPSKRSADLLDQAFDVSITKNEEPESSTSYLKKRRFDDTSSSKTNHSSRSTPVPNDAYEFVDDEEDIPNLGKSTQSPVTFTRSTKFMDLAKKDMTLKNRPPSANADISKPEKSFILTKKTEIIATPTFQEEMVSSSAEFKETSPIDSVIQIENSPNEPRVSPVPKIESPREDSNPLPSASDDHFNCESILQSESQSADSAAFLQSGEDLEVQKILSNTEIKNDDESDTKSEHNELVSDDIDHTLRSSVASNESSKKESPNEDISDYDDNDQSPLGPLIMADDDEDEDEDEDEKLDSSSLVEESFNPTLDLEMVSSSPIASFDHSVVVSLENIEEDEKNLSEVTQSADSGESNESKDEKGSESTSSVDSLLLCEETVIPASPPASPPPISSQVPEPSSLHHPAPSQSLQSDYFRSQLSPHQTMSIDHNRLSFMNKDQSIQDCQSQGSKTSFTTPAFLANLHRNQMAPQSMSLTNQSVSNQPFSTLIAAAVSQQAATNQARLIPSKGKSTVFVPPEVAMNIMNLNPSRARASREEEINDADDEGAPGMEIDDDDDDNDSDEDAKPYLRKMEPPIVNRKRRSIRSESKISSSSSPVAAGILSSQESSQDGDDMDEEIQKFSEEKKLRSKSLKSSDLDLKNDEDSMSGCRSNRDHDVKNFKSPAPSPKKRRRGRMRNLSQSDNRDASSVGQSYSERTRERTLGCRTRGRYRHSTGPLHSDLGYTSNIAGFYPRINSASELSAYTPSSSNIQAIIANLKPSDPVPFDYSEFEEFDHVKFPYMKPIPMSIPPDERIKELKERMDHVRKKYFEMKTKLAEADRKKKRALQRKKDRERKEQRELAKATAAANAAAVQSDSDSDSSSSKNERSSRSSRRDNGNGSGRSSARSEDNCITGISDPTKLVQEEAS